MLAMMTLPDQSFQLCPDTYAIVLKDSYGDGNGGSGTVSLEDGSVIANLPSISDSSTTIDFGSDCEGTWGGNATCACDENERVLAGNCVACAPGTTNEAGDETSDGDTECDATLCGENEYVQDNTCVICAEGTNAAGDDASGSNTVCDIAGCTNVTANNYASNATQDDGSCTCEDGAPTLIYILLTDSYADGNSGSGKITNLDGVLITNLPGIDSDESITQVPLCPGTLQS